MAIPNVGLLGLFLATQFPHQRAIGATDFLQFLRSNCSCFHPN
jgi:hypothetical protein